MKVGMGRKPREKNREERERVREEGKSKEVQERRAKEKRGRLASQFPAARYIYETHKVASTTAYIAA